MAVPCMTRATPIPLRRWGEPLTWCHWGSLYLPAQPMAAAPCWAHSSNPQVWRGAGGGGRAGSPKSPRPGVFEARPRVGGDGEVRPPVPYPHLLLAPEAAPDA